MSRFPPVLLPMHFFPLSSRSLLILATFCWLLFAAAALLMAGGWLNAFDRAGLLIWRGGTPPSEFLLESVRDITALGGVFLRNSFAVLGMCLLLLLRFQKSALWLAFTVAVGWALNTGAKWLVYRPRPDFLPHWTEAVGPSFPSGHSFNGAVVFLATGLLVSGLVRRSAVKRLIMVTAVLISLAIAWSRVWLGVHYPSDVIAGWLGGAGWVCLSAALASRWIRGDRHHPAARL